MSECTCGACCYARKHPQLQPPPRCYNASPKCPTCDSPDPARHPAVQHEGEVHVCPDPFHTSTERGREVMSMVERQQRPHGVEAAGAGDLGKVSSGMEFGPCPGCGAELRTMQITDPHTNRAARALAHPTPFCTYFGETDSTVIERAVTAARAS